MKCPCCGVEVEASQMDVAFGLPDVIFALPQEQRDARARTHSDLCSLDDGRYFIRGVVYIPVQQLGTKFGWGVWAEVSEDAFLRYRELYDKDGSDEPYVAGVLANTPPDYIEVEQPLKIQFGPPDKRPIFTLTHTQSELFREQTEGLDLAKWHRIVERYAS
jgi:hypothetical protein